MTAILSSKRLVKYLINTHIRARKEKKNRWVSMPFQKTWKIHGFYVGAAFGFP